MGRSAVIGLGFGDEGKGVVTDFLCSQNPASTVVRFSGGHQAAHTVKCGGTEHIFSNFGSGTLRGCPTYWSDYCTFEPVGFCREYDVLKSKGITPKIYIHGSCRVTTPYDILANRTSPERNNGTTGTGFWKTIERNQLGVSLNIFDVLWGTQRLGDVKRYYSFGDVVNLNDFHKATERINAMLGKDVFLVALPPAETNLIFEGSQGLLLDKDIGFFPHVTPSKTNLDNILKMGHKLDDVYLVTRAYQTRHGAGPITNEEIPINVQQTHERSTSENEFQGKLRKTALDLDLLEYGVKEGVQGVCKQESIIKHLVVTCLDQVNGEFMLTYDKKVKTFHDAEDFVHYIGTVLGIDGKLYGNYSPCSDSIQNIKGELVCHMS
jgi:adenylosuccinate synthase